MPTRGPNDGVHLTEPGAEGFSPFYDLKNGIFIGSANPQELHHFPVRLTYRTTELLNFRTGLQTSPQAEEYQTKLDALIGAITGYRLPVVELRDLSVPEVCPIFERINSSGTKLSPFDLIAAATWTENFDLSDQSEEIGQAIEPKGFDGISNPTILKCIAARLLNSVKKEDVLSLRSKDKEDISTATNEVKDAMLRAVDLLTTEFHMRSMAFLPYEAQLVTTVYLLTHLRSLSSDQLKRYRAWFWRSSFSQHYRGASEAFISSSLEDVHNWVGRGAGDASTFGSAPGKERLLKEDFHFRGAVTKAYVLALARRAPRNLTTGALIDVGESLSVYNKRQFHHIFPQAFLKRSKIKQRTNSFANICMLSARENNLVGDADPQKYLTDCASSLKDDCEDVFRSALLPSPSTFNYSACNFEQFLDARASILAAHVAELCEGKA